MCQCTSMEALIQFRAWLKSLPLPFNNHGGKFAGISQDYHKGISNCIVGKQFACGYHDCGRNKDIMQPHEKIIMFAELIRKKDNLILQVGVKEPFMFGHVTLAKLLPQPHHLFPSLGG